MELTHPLLPKLGISPLRIWEEPCRTSRPGNRRWTYVEFLSWLLEDEGERRPQTQQALRQRRAGFDSLKLGRS